MADTIFATSSGTPPAAIAVIRISGPQASEAMRALAGHVPLPRRACVATLCDERGGVLDRALVLWMPGPGSATGEDMAELHCHGGRAVVAAVEAALARLPLLRRAMPGEFTRRAFMNGRLDLAETEGLADLLAAETELQRQAAMAMASGAVSRETERWRDAVLTASAAVEAVLDFADEGDVAVLPPDFSARLFDLRAELAEWLARPRGEALREGVKVVIAGPPNAGKSTLFNALVESEAAITAPMPGTTRDVLSRSVAIDGVPFTFLDTAGLRDGTGDAIEAIGMERARHALVEADIVLWLGPEGEGPEKSWEIAARLDAPDHLPKSAPRHGISARTGEGMDGLRRDLTEAARGILPKPGMAALTRRQYELVAEAEAALGEAERLMDPLLVAECLRSARVAFDALLGRSTTEDMLDALFGRFCIGK